MKKIIFTAIVLLALPALVLAAFQPATLFKGASRVAVFTEDVAKMYFGMGYQLETKGPVSAPVKVEKVCDCDELLGAAGSVFSDGITISGVTEKWITGDCRDASTTLFAFKNPFGDTAYIDKAIINITGVSTTSLEVIVGTSSSPNLASAPTDTLIDEVTVATSTRAQIANSIIGGARSETSGLKGGGTNSEDIIVLRGSDYVAGYVEQTGTIGTAGVTNAANTFKCKYYIHVFK